MAGAICRCPRYVTDEGAEQSVDTLHLGLFCRISQLVRELHGGIVLSKKFQKRHLLENMILRLHAQYQVACAP